MGNFFQGSNNTQQTQTSAPLSWQAQPVQNLFGQTQSLENSQQGLQYNGQLYAGTNATENNAANMMTANGLTAAGYAPNEMAAGNAALPGLSAAMAGYGNYADGNFNTGMYGAGNVLAGNAANGVAATNAGLSAALNGIANNTASNVANEAGTYMNNNVLNGQINAVGTDISRNLGQQINGLNAAAALNGNMDSSRAGAAQGIYTSQAQENLANAAANIRGNAYNTGLNLAEGQNVANINAGLGAASAGNNAAMAALSGQTANNAQINAANSFQMQGNAGLANGAVAGSNMLTQGNALGQAGAQEAYAGGSVAQQNAQNQDNANYQQFMLNNETLPWASLNNASSILQARNWGGTQTTNTTQTQTPSGFSDLMSGLGLLGAGISGMGGFSSPTVNTLGGASFGNSATGPWGSLMAATPTMFA